MEGKIDKTGVMIHNVISEVDMGTPILVREIPFIKGVDEDLEALEQRIHEIEWKAVVEGTGIVLKELQEERSIISAKHADLHVEQLEG
jgi:phosphoribosylglycinamide formyltransferase